MLLMIDMVKDIEVIEAALIGLHEGASDEKYAAMISLGKLLVEKKEALNNFEAMLESYNG